MSGYLSEIFASFEGEGDRVGMPAAFVRMAGCNLACSYCDTGYARERTDSATLYAGRRESRIPNPLSPGRLARIVADAFPGCPDLRFTGGEPLLQADFVGEAALLLRAMGLGLHLETNGTLAREMARLRRLFQTVTMDMKLPSTQEGRSLEAEHSEFLEALASGPGPPAVAVKIVVTPECTDEEVMRAFSVVRQVGPRAAVFLQPEFDDKGPVVSGERMLKLMRAGLESLHDVRISLQTHKVLRMR
jgi:7-carboxy-7-deazaguanine synthase